MMFDGWLLLLLVIAIGTGWLLGRFSRVSSQSNAAPVHSQYYKSLGFLLNDQPDDTLDSFISSLDVNRDTLETHIAVGNLMRRKGEVERAIRIHQNLLSRPSLPNVFLHQAHLELARDYISAGLLDRAERLLQDLIAESTELKQVAMRHLLEIYQDEKEWQQAIDLARQLLPKRSLLKAPAIIDGELSVALSHYCCELAAVALQKNDYHSARQSIKQALSYDKHCVRASLLAAEIEYRSDHFDKAIKCLHKVSEQDPVHIPETLQLYRLCADQMGDKQIFQEYLQQMLDDKPSVTVLLTAVTGLRAEKGDQAAAEFLALHLQRRPSLRGLATLVELHIANTDENSKQNLSLLQLLISQLMKSKPHYKCQQCGFTGKHLHWLCPSCKHWGQVKAIQGAEGD